MDNEKVRFQLDRILASAALVDADRSASFLRFVVERTLAGRSNEIKESVIAVEVLGRTTSFDPKLDSIVRVEAARLRDRLSSYYEAEGGADSVVISLPKGRYVPEFAERRPLDAALTAGTLRLSILPPENAAFESFAVSPDGRKLAFTAPRDGRLMLWVRSLDSLEARPLAGTDYASWPFWSPDSGSIGFSVPNKLKAIPISGGPPRDIANTVVGRGGAWSQDGIILFCPRPMGVLHQVSAVGGGVPVPATALDQDRFEVAHGFPQFLPDGRHFLFLAACSRSGMSSIRAGSLDSTRSKVLVSSDVPARYAGKLRGRSPSLLFVHDGALVAQAFDVRELELTGDRTVIVSDVSYRRWDEAKFSVSGNGILLYQAGCAEVHQLAWFDRRGHSIAEIGPRNEYRSISLSPDERYVAVNRFDDPGSALPTIWVLDLLRPGATFRLTDADVALSEFTPVWAPAGGEILFSRGDDRRMGLFRQALSGGPAICVLDTDGPKFPTAWSSDSRFVAYASQVPDYRYLHLWVVTIKGGEEPNPHPFLLHSYEEFGAQFSPADETEGPRWVAYTSAETGRYEVCVRDFPHGHHKWQISSQGGMQPHWRRDGRELFYFTLDGMLMSVSVTADAVFAFEEPKPLFTAGFRFLARFSFMNQYAVSHDAQRFLINRPVSEPTRDAITALIPW